MRLIIALLTSVFVSFTSLGKEVKDTIRTPQNDKIILTYNVTNDGNNLSIDIGNHPRIIPSENLKQECKGEYDKLKVVAFDRIGDFGKVKWKGMVPKALMIPAGLNHDATSEGYYILGESQPITFSGNIYNVEDINIPLYIAIYEKKQNYKIVAASQTPLTVKPKKLTNSNAQRGQRNTEVERVAIHSSEEVEIDNTDITSALSSIELVKELLSRETAIPFSQTLQMEIYNLRNLKNTIKEQEIVDRINELLLQCTEKEQALKAAESSAALAAKAEEKALLEQQRQEAEAQQQAAEEKAREEQEKQQKRTLWMIIGGVILAILAFIGNAIFKHFRDISNQKSIMQMQESLAQQAAHEATRRSREVVYNKAHKAVNKGRGKLRDTVQKTDKSKKNNKRPSI